MKIRLILFDLGGVIYTSDRHEAARRFGSLGLKDAENQLNMYTQTGLFGALEEGKISDKEFVAQLSDKVGKSLSWDDCRLAWLGYATFLPQRNLDVLLRLRHMGFRLALASNTNPFMMSWIDCCDFDGKGNSIRSYLDELYVSYKIKALKPSPVFFEYILQKEKVQAENVLFIDDGPRNVEAAHSLGIHTVLAVNGEDWTEDVLRLCTQTNF